jgi:hypothetical protein
MTQKKLIEFESLKKLTDQLKAMYTRIQGWLDKIKTEPLPQVQYVLLGLAERELASSGSLTTKDLVISVREYHDELIRVSGELYVARQAEAEAKAAVDSKNAVLKGKADELDNLEKNQVAVLEKEVRDYFGKPVTTGAAR